ncbi:hypothetical protein [Streptomyces sp. NPDC056492]|uniref:hypothetical protein n=1 Tax=Streptomyces sp. NPDC056492 TaxID=3345838 RepID=UPI0036C782BD
MEGEGEWIRQRLAREDFEAWHFFRYGSTGSAPTYVFIRPVDGADPAAVARGITTTVLRDVAPAEAAQAVSPARAARRYPHAERVEKLLRTSQRPGDEYLAAIALRYERLADAGERSPVRALVDLTGRSLGTVKSHVQLARKRGFLGTVGTKAGGRATDLAREVFNAREAPSG